MDSEGARGKGAGRSRRAVVEVQLHLSGTHTRTTRTQSELTQIEPKQVSISDDGCIVRVVLGEVKAARIYQLDLIGLTSAAGHPLAHPTVCYTLNRLAK